MPSSSDAVQFTCRFFTALSLQELYLIWKLRNQVFIVEQHCPYLDADDKDLAAYHLMGFTASGTELVAYTRLLAPGISYSEMSIGRVVVHPAYRKLGIGKKLMQKSIATIQAIYGRGPIRIGAQLYLRSFYESLGFEVCSDIYLEDDIPHVQMLWHPRVS